MTAHADTLTPAVGDPAGSAGTLRPRLVAGTLALAATTVAGVLLVRPWPERDAFDYGQVAPSRDSIWLGVMVDGLAFALVGITLALVVSGLVRARGATWATIGAGFTAVGGVVFAMGAYAFGALAWYATDTSTLDGETGGRLLDRAVDEVTHGMLLQMAGFLCYTVGTLLLCVALLRSGAVPRAIPAAVLVLTVVQFTPVPGRVLDLVQVALMGVLVALAVLAARTHAPRLGKPQD